METTTHTYQAGEYSPRAGRRVCAICGETQGSRFHSVPSNGYWIIIDGGDYRMGGSRFRLQSDAWDFIDGELEIGLMGYAAARAAYCHPFESHSNRPRECRHCGTAADAAWHGYTTARKGQAS